MNPAILFIIFSFLSSLFPLRAYPIGNRDFSTDLTIVAKNDAQSSSGKELSGGPPKAVEEYEKQKLAKLKRNIGRRLITDRKIKPADFYESPDNLDRKLPIAKEKEGFVITEVVQNQPGTMNFYKVKLDTGQIGYLSADGNYLELKLKERSLLPASGRTGRKSSPGRARGQALEAINRVKNHPTGSDPADGNKKTVEKKMMDEKAKTFPYPRWRYEAKEIGGGRFRVIQYVEDRGAPPFVRKWIVDLDTNAVKPENLPAQELYR